MKLSSLMICLLSLITNAQSLYAYTCDTTRVDEETMHGMDGLVYVADCRILTEEGAPFVLESGERAYFTSEQLIRLAPGFKAKHGSRFHAKLRDCIRNPEPGQCYASWGSYDRYTTNNTANPDAQWMKLTVEALVDGFKNDDLSVNLKYGQELAKYGVHIPDFYCDEQRINENVAAGAPLPTNCTGRDDDHSRLTIDDLTSSIAAINLAGIDDGVLFFHVGHGGGDPLGPHVRDGDETGTTPGKDSNNNDIQITDGNTTKILWNQFRLGNCSSDDSETGELRYLWLCSCRSFAHGAPITRTDGKGDEFDRPSLFDPTVTAPAHPNAFARLGPVLGENMRMACGVSTSASCQQWIAGELITGYFDNELSVAETWAMAQTAGTPREYHELTDTSGNPILDSSGQPMKRRIYTTPLCIARGNNDPNDLRSPITDDLRFNEKANPYDEALHIAYWETIGDTTDAELNIEVTNVKSDSGFMTTRLHNPHIKVSLASGIQHVDKSQVKKVEERLSQLPVILTKPTTPTWKKEGKARVADDKFISEAKTSEDYIITNDKLTSKEMTNDKRPKLKINLRKGVITLAGDRARLNAEAKIQLQTKDYMQLASSFIQEQGWNETDMGDLRTIRAGLQVMPLNNTAKPPQQRKKVLDMQKDITIIANRRLQLDDMSVKMLDTDNRILVQMNNDGSIIRASKQWSGIKHKQGGIPVKSFDTAYNEALQHLANPSLYELVTWDWGYKAISHSNGQDLMVGYYRFNFEPNSQVFACIDSPRTIDIQAHLLESGMIVGTSSNNSESL
jgi:hypothetical protein